MFLVIARTFRGGMNNFWRNGWLSVAAVSVLVLSLYIIGVMLVVTVTTNGILKNIQEKVNISVYFKPDVSEDRINQIKVQLEESTEVKSAEFVSKEKALEDFKRNNANEPVIMQSLEEIGGNPLLSSLVIKANEPGQYETISSFVSGDSFKEDVSRVNYGKNKEIINKLNGIISEIKRIGLVLVAVFSAIAILIIFNTIRIAIYTHKQEIEVMRLVGSSNMFIRLPFIFEGVVYGIVASLVSMLLLFVTLKFLSPYLTRVIPTENLLSFYFSRFGILILIQTAFGVFLGVVSSVIAVRKYLRI